MRRSLADHFGKKCGGVGRCGRKAVSRKLNKGRALVPALLLRALSGLIIASFWISAWNSGRVLHINSLATLLNQRICTAKTSEHLTTLEVARHSPQAIAHTPRNARGQNRLPLWIVQMAYDDQFRCCESRIDVANVLRYSQKRARLLGLHVKSRSCMLTRMG